MANLTLTINDDTLKRARIRALEQGTSVNAVVRDYLERFAGDTAERAALRSVVAAAEASSSGARGHGRTWTRDELHDR